MNKENNKITMRINNIAFQYKHLPEHSDVGGLAGVLPTVDRPLPQIRHVDGSTDSRHHRLEFFPGEDAQPL